MKAYLAGPMTGIPRFNFPAFIEAAGRLRYDEGHWIISPAELDDKATRLAAMASMDGKVPDGGINGETWGDLLARDVKIVADEVEAIIFLPDWERSRGARLEATVGLECGLRFYRYDTEVEGLVYEISREQIERAIALGRTPLEVVDESDIGLGHEGEDIGPEEMDADMADHYGTGNIMEQVAEMQRGINEETRVTDPNTGGQKGQKLAELGALEPRALLEVAKVAGFGARKYARHNYLNGYAWSLSYDALQRHLLAFAAGEDLDPESGLPHLAHAGWHCLALLAFQLHSLGTDDRWLPQEPGHVDTDD